MPSLPVVEDLQVLEVGGGGALGELPRDPIAQRPADDPAREEVQDDDQIVLASLDPAVDPAFSEVRLDLSAFAGSPTVQVRFTFTADASVDFEGWYVDNIRVEQSTFDCGLEVVSTTTTTLPPASCQRDADCNDGDPCTTDRCAGGQCVSSPSTDPRAPSASFTRRSKARSAGAPSASTRGSSTSSPHSSGRPSVWCRRAPRGHRSRSTVSRGVWIGHCLPSSRR